MNNQYIRMVAIKERLRLKKLKEFDIQPIRVSRLKLLIDCCMEATTPLHKRK